MSNEDPMTDAFKKQIAADRRLLAERAGNPPRTVDGRTLLVLVHVAENYLDRTSPGYIPANPKEVQAAIQNVKYAMEHVHFTVPTDG